MHCKIGSDFHHLTFSFLVGELDNGSHMAYDHSYTIVNAAYFKFVVGDTTYKEIGQLSETVVNSFLTPCNPSYTIMDTM